tara:strand:+ start:756 stop:1490 length:735 start_codon:yes stop_codon:yes gene_type:complete
MCTVTFIPKSLDGFILTSNRDEAPARKAIQPMVYNVDDVELVYPKDEVAGGTWFGLSSKKRLICLLNGGFTAHHREDSYRMSRGSIVLDLLVSEDVLAAIDIYNFNGVEPFTIIMVDWKRELVLYELVWDGSMSHLSEQPLAPQIWSSSLLYPEEMKKKREAWFSEFIFNNLNPSEAELLEFHKTAGEGSKEADLIMDRGFVKTKSITQLSKSKFATFRYEDLQTSEVSQVEISDYWKIKSETI